VLSVNTVDGSTDYHVAMALLWVRDGSDVTERNEAYAYASCNDCRTGAVAFQVILIVGYSGTITPVNSAVSANYACERCSTQAVAVQLVATLSREPDAANEEQARADLGRPPGEVRHLQEPPGRAGLRDPAGRRAAGCSKSSGRPAAREQTSTDTKGETATSADDHDAADDRHGDHASGRDGPDRGDDDGRRRSRAPTSRRHRDDARRERPDDRDRTTTETHADRDHADRDQRRPEPPPDDGTGG
jgi:putative peptide zinc metalloprotease protein